MLPVSPPSCFELSSILLVHACVPIVCSLLSEGKETCVTDVHSFIQMVVFVSTSLVFHALKLVQVYCLQCFLVWCSHSEFVCSLL